MDSLYPLTLSLHNVLRWVPVIFGILASLRALQGWWSKRGWDDLDDKLGRYFALGLDSQVLIGLILYLFLSPITKSAMAGMGAAMADPTLRYFAVEHASTMILALILAHIGRSRVKKTADSAGKHRMAAIFFGLATLAMLAAVPWPWVAQARPLLRLMGFNWPG